MRAALTVSGDQQFSSPVCEPGVDACFPRAQYSVPGFRRVHSFLVPEGKRQPHSHYPGMVEPDSRIFAAIGFLIDFRRIGENNYVFFNS